MGNSRISSESSNAERAGGSDLSLVLGGPFYQLLLRAGLVTPPLDRLAARMLVVSLLPWLPLLALTLIEGTAFGSGIAVPFLRDLEVHVRFLVAMPLLVLAERVVHERLRPIVQQFRERNLIEPEQRDRFEAFVASGLRLRDSLAAEAIIALISFVVMYWPWASIVSLEVPTWYGSRADGPIRLTQAGWGYAFFSLPLFRFLVFRWYFRLFIWYRFLWQVSRLRLRLVPTHPDRAGGLGFLGGGVFAFTPVLLAHTAFASANIANSIFHEGRNLTEYRSDIGVGVALMILAALVPLGFFCVKLNTARRVGMRDYGALAQRYARDFAEKWLDGRAGGTEPLLGSADIQSLADMGGSFDVIREMGLMPIGMTNVVRLAVVVALPYAPLLLTIFDFEELVQRGLGILF